MTRVGTWLRRRGWKFWLGILVGMPLALWIAGGLVVSLLLTQARPSDVPDWRDLDGHPIRAAEITTDDGVTVRGWLIHPVDRPETSRCVVLISGIGSNRLGMVQRARFYLDQGWCTLMVDLRGTGESDPERISMGWHEARDLVAWHSWLDARGFATIAAHGQSLGAATVTYSASEIPWAWAVLEQCYGDIDSALHNRVPWAPWPELSLWPMHAASQWLLDVDRRDLRPVDAVRALGCPTLIICGDGDRSVGDGWTEQLHARAAGEPKRLVWIQNADHVNLWSHDPARMEAALSAWLDDVGR